MYKRFFLLFLINNICVGMEISQKPKGKKLELEQTLFLPSGQLISSFYDYNKSAIVIQHRSKDALEFDLYLTVKQKLKNFHFWGFHLNPADGTFLILFSGQNKDKNEVFGFFKKSPEDFSGSLNEISASEESKIKNITLYEGEDENLIVRILLKTADYFRKFNGIFNRQNSVSIKDFTLEARYQKIQDKKIISIEETFFTREKVLSIPEKSEKSLIALSETGKNLCSDLIQGSYHHPILSAIIFQTFRPRYLLGGLDSLILDNKMRPFLTGIFLYGVAFKIGAHSVMDYKKIPHSHKDGVLDWPGLFEKLGCKDKIN